MSWIWIVLAAAISFLVAGISGKFLIPFLRKLKFGQTILEEGPKWHESKQGTPTMGGFMFIIGMTVAMIAVFTAYGFFHEGLGDLLPNKLVTAKVFGGLLLAYTQGAIGFIDDYIKIVKKRNLGLTAKQKLVLQFASAALYTAILSLNGASTRTLIPLIGYIDLGIFYPIISTVVIAGMCNAVNLTDGIDGLNGSISFFFSVFLSVIATIYSLHSLSIFSMAIAGGCLGFLIWNFHPAKVFMGDTGSLFLGGAVCAMAFGVDMPILLLPIGIMYLVEMFSVILQVSYFKYTKKKYKEGKRLFKMSPLHHHFEMCGWSEEKIVIVFSLITVFFGVLSVVAVIGSFLKF